MFFQVKGPKVEENVAKTVSQKQKVTEYDWLASPKIWNFPLK